MSTPVLAQTSSAERSTFGSINGSLADGPLASTEQKENRSVVSPALISPTKSAGRGSIPLDQWRGLALVLVLISHGFFFTEKVNGIGRVGVNLFFFISGILVYKSLQKTRDPCSKVSRDFWWRRFRRLYPALVAYVLVMLVATVFLQHLPHPSPYSDLRSYLRALPLALTYSINYVHGRPASLGHLWSLACEVQFYTLAPLLFGLGSGGRTRGVLVFGAAALILTLMGLIYPLRAANYELARYHFEIAAWPMMIGFLCEFWKGWFQRLSRGLVRVLYGAGFAALAASLLLMPFSAHAKKLVIAMGALSLVPCFLAYLFDLPFPRKVGFALAWMGERTYSIYLWQQPFTICNYLPFILQPFGAAAAIPVGAFWFRLCEKPFLSARRTQQIQALPVHTG